LRQGVNGVCGGDKVSQEGGQGREEVTASLR
jgi:hypothetical protein